jgi:hypothetical protein
VAWLAGTHGARARWLSTQAPALLGELADHRNPAAHAQVTTRAQVLPLRNQWLGVGCHGQLVELARLVEAAGLGGRPRASRTSRTGVSPATACDTRQCKCIVRK